MTRRTITVPLAEYRADPVKITRLVGPDTAVKVVDDDGCTYAWMSETSGGDPCCDAAKAADARIRLRAAIRAGLAEYALWCGAHKLRAVLEPLDPEAYANATGPTREQLRAALKRGADELRDAGRRKPRGRW